MKILQWSMTIPEEKQKRFVKWFGEVAGPKLGKFGAVEHELYNSIQENHGLCPWMN